MEKYLYFMNVSSGKLYRILKSKAKQLLKDHPNWLEYDSVDNDFELAEVYHFFETNGEMVGEFKSNIICTYL